MRSFLTGSYAYGKPRSDSDIDLVVLVTEVFSDYLEENGFAGAAELLREKFGKRGSR